MLLNRLYQLARGIGRRFLRKWLGSPRITWNSRPSALPARFSAVAIKGEGLLHRTTFFINCWILNLSWHCLDSLQITWNNFSYDHEVVSYAYELRWFTLCRTGRLQTKVGNTDDLWPFWIDSILRAVWGRTAVIWFLYCVVIQQFQFNSDFQFKRQPTCADSVCFILGFLEISWSAALVTDISRIASITATGTRSLSRSTTLKSRWGTHIHMNEFIS